MIMRFLPRRRRLGHPGATAGRSAARWIVAAAGLVVLAVALVGAAGPFRQTQEFRAAVQCDRGRDDCFGTEPGSVVARRTYTTTSTTTDADGFMHTTTTQHWEVTWRRADGVEQSRDVSPEFYAKAEEGEPAHLRIWHGEVVGLEVMGASHWFLPESGRTLGYWLVLAHFGLGVLLWGMIFGWWDGFFMLAYRLFCWMFLSFMPVGLITDALTYGLELGIGLVVRLVFAALFTAVGGAMLIGSLRE